MGRVFWALAPVPQVISANVKIAATCLISEGILVDAKMPPRFVYVNIPVGVKIQAGGSRTLLSLVLIPGYVSLDSSSIPPLTEGNFILFVSVLFLPVQSCGEWRCR